MNKAEIIEDVAASYTSETRAIYGANTCLYKAPNGQRCAVGRYLITDQFDDWKGGAGSLEYEFEGLDQYLRKDVRGHELAFWTDVQKLHDEPLYWDKQGLSPEGLDYKNELLEKWS